MNISSIVLILQMALSLLNTPNLESNPQLKQQAILIASQAIIIANEALEQLPTTKPSQSAVVFQTKSYSVPTINPNPIQPSLSKEVVSGDVIVTSITRESDKYIEIKPTGESFSIEALTFVAGDKESRKWISPSSKISLFEPNSNSIIAELNVFECQVSESLFQELKKIPYPYPCPGREIKTTEEYDNASVLGYSSPKIDWNDYQRYNFQINNGNTYRFYFNKDANISLYYLKAVGITSGKAIEKTF